MKTEKVLLKVVSSKSNDSHASFTFQSTRAEINVFKVKRTDIKEDGCGFVGLYYLPTPPLEQDMTQGQFF